LQTVVGPRMKFLDVVPEYPGSQHDSRIFQNLKIYARYRRKVKWKIGWGLDILLFYLCWYL